MKHDKKTQSLRTKARIERLRERLIIDGKTQMVLMMNLSGTMRVHVK